MIKHLKIMGGLVVFFLFFLAAHAEAAGPIAEITAFDGDVIVLTGRKVTRVETLGYSLNEGDRVQTKEGHAEVTFEDGAIITISPYTTTQIQVKQEEKGFWIFKTKATVRRITCFIGKLRFKSGSEIHKNYLQTPTATAGVRGSEGEIGYNNVESFINEISGEYDLVGTFVQGFFENPGVDAASKNKVFKALESAYQKFQEAEASGDTGDAAQAELSGLEAIQAAAQEMQQNPDESVAQEAQEVLTIVESQIQQVQQEIESGGNTGGSGNGSGGNGDSGGGSGNGSGNGDNSGGETPAGYTGGDTGDGGGQDGGNPDQGNNPGNDPSRQQGFEATSTSTTTSTTTTTTTTTEEPTTTTTTTTTTSTTTTTTTTTTSEETTTTTEAPATSTANSRFDYDSSPEGHTWSEAGDDNYIKLTNGSVNDDSGQLTGSPTIKFSFPFYGKEYTDVFVVSNGYLTFVSGEDDYSPSVSEFKQEMPRIAPFWTDPDFRTDTSHPDNGTLTVESTNSHFRVTWDNVDYYSYTAGNNQASFSTTLYQSGWIVFSYGNLGTDQHGALVGLSPGSGGSGSGHPGESESRSWQSLDMSTLSNYVYFYDDESGSPVYKGIYEFWEYASDGSVNSFDLSNSYIIFRPDKPGHSLMMASADTVVDIKSLDTAILWSDTNDELFESNYLPGQFSTSGTSFNFPGKWSGGSYRSAEDNTVSLGLQLLGTDNENDTPKLFINSDTLDDINRNGFLAYAVQVEEDRVNQKIIDMYKNAASASVQQSINNAIAANTIRSRDDLLMQKADAQAGRVTKDRNGNWVRSQQYVLRPDDNSVQVLNVTLRGGTGSLAGMSTIDARTTFTGDISGENLKTLPWNKWMNTQITPITIGSGETQTTYNRYVYTSSSSDPVLNKMSVEFKNPSSESLKEERFFDQTIRSFTDGGNTDYFQAIGSEKLHLKNDMYTYTSATDPGDGEYKVVGPGSGSNPNPGGFQYNYNPTGSASATNIDVGFFVIKDTAETTDTNGISSTDYSSKGFKDIWDALRVNSSGAQNIGNNILEMVIDKDTSSGIYSNPIDVLYIPMSRMLWKE